MGEDIAYALQGIDEYLHWCQKFLANLSERCDYEIENRSASHWDIEYLYCIYPVLHDDGTFATIHIDAYRYRMSTKSYGYALRSKPICSGNPESFITAVKQYGKPRV